MDHNLINAMRLEAQRMRDEAPHLADSAEFRPDPSIPYLKYDEAFAKQGDGKLTLRPPGNTLNTATSIVPTAKDQTKFWVTAWQTFFDEPEPPNYAAIARINQKGEMDTSFGSEGFAKVAFDDKNYTALDCLHEHSDGKLIVFGELIKRQGAGSYRQPMIIRLMPDGAVDKSFGTNGIVDLVTTISKPAERAFYGVDAQGRTLVLAQIYKEDYPISVLARLTAEGKLDETFKMVEIQKDGHGAYPIDIMLDKSDKKIFITFLTPSAAHYIVCFDSDGRLDRAFGSDGFADLSGHLEAVASCSFTQKSKHLFISGQSYDETEAYATLANFTTGGKPELKFNEGRPVESYFAKLFPDRIWYSAYELAGDPFTIKTLGWYGNSSDSYQVLGRFTRVGASDGSFVENEPIGQLLADDYFSYGHKNFINDAPKRFLVAGRSLSAATIFAVKEGPE